MYQSKIRRQTTVRFNLVWHKNREKNYVGIYLKRKVKQT